MTKRFEENIFFMLVNCFNYMSPVQIYDSSHITEEEVVTALHERGITLVEVKFKKSIFGSKLRNVIPAAYEINEKPFFIFEFKTENELAKAIKEFNNKTATMDLVSASEFEKRNILIFYVHEHDINSEHVPFVKEIQNALDNIIEG